MTTILSWGLIRYRRTYETIGQLDYALDCIKWATDYFIKCHTDKFEFWAQVSIFNVFILSIVEKSQCNKMFKKIFDNLKLLKKCKYNFLSYKSIANGLRISIFYRIYNTFTVHLLYKKKYYNFLIKRSETKQWTDNFKEHPKI